MNDDAIADVKPGRDLGFPAGLMTYADGCPLGSSVDDSIDRPLVAFSEPGAGWHRQDVLRLPHDDTDFYTVRVFDCVARRRCPASVEPSRADDAGAVNRIVAAWARQPHHPRPRRGREPTAP